MFKKGDLIHFDPFKSKREFEQRESGVTPSAWASSYTAAEAKVTLGRVVSDIIPGFFYDQEFSYKMGVLTWPLENVVEVHEGDDPTLVPIQAHTVLERILLGELDYTSIKNVPIVTIPSLQVNPHTNKAGSLTWEKRVLISTHVVSHSGGKRTYSPKAPRLKRASTPLEPVHWVLRSVRKSPKTGNLRFVTTAPASSWDPKTGNVGAAAIKTYYFTARAVQCSWLLEDYEAYVSSLPSEQEHTSAPDQ